MKPLGIKNYGSIGHLPCSRIGPGDHHVHDGQAAICTTKVRDRHDLVIVQEKLDGSNVGAAKVNGEIHALTRAGYLASTSPYEQHHRFGEWVARNASRFAAVLQEGERIVGEWLLQAHGTRYLLKHEPFVAFDLMRGKERTPFAAFRERVGGHFVMPYLIHTGGALSVADAMAAMGEMGQHGAMEPVEGVMYRVERNEQRGAERVQVVDFLAKYVRPDKADGCYLEGVTGGPAVYNDRQWWVPGSETA